MHHKKLVQHIRRLCSEELKPRPTATRARLQHARGIKAVLFDVYGTLLISGTGDIGTASESTPAESLREAFASLGFSHGPGAGSLALVAQRGVSLFLESIRNAHADRKAAGISHPEVEIRDIWRTVLEGLADATLLEKGCAGENVERLAIEYECRVNPVWPMPGLRPLLLSLEERGLVMGIVSNAQFYTPLTFVALCGQSLTELGFEEDYCSWSYEELTAKPSVCLYEAVLERLKRSAAILPSETLYVGNDMLNDVWAASQAGCRTALFAGDKRSLRRREDDPRCRDLQPDLVLTELGQLPQCLG